MDSTSKSVSVSPSVVTEKERPCVVGDWDRERPLVGDWEREKETMCGG